MAYLQKCDEDMTLFLQLMGSPMSDEEQLAQLQKILHRSPSMEMSVRVIDFKEPLLFREWTDAKAACIRERGGKDAHVAEVELHQPPPAAPPAAPSGQGDVTEGEYGHSGDFEDADLL